MNNNTNITEEFKKLQNIIEFTLKNRILKKIVFSSPVSNLTSPNHF
jgi:hypothetical protein